MHNIVAIFICCVLPIAIVLIVFLANINADNKRAKVLIKAIEANNAMDVDKLAEALQKPRRSAAEILNKRLLRGCIFTLVGVALIIISFVNLANGSTFQDDPTTVPMVFGGLSIAVGLSFLIVYFVTRHQADETPQK